MKEKLGRGGLAQHVQRRKLDKSVGVEQDIWHIDVKLVKYRRGLQEPRGLLPVRRNRVVLLARI